MPRPPAAHGTPQRWRTGCRCQPCGQAHNDDTRNRRREAAVDALDQAADQLWALLECGVSLQDAAARHGFTRAQIQGRARWDLDWRARLDDALTTGRDPSLEHGTEGAYRHGNCRCPECRRAHHT